MRSADKGLNVLQVMRAPVGGLFRHVADLTRGLAARGHRVGIVVDSLASDARTEVTLEDLAQHTALGIHRVPIPRLLGIADIGASRTIRRLARERDVAVLHGHGAKGGFHARLARIGRQAPKAVYTPHGGVLHFSPRSVSGRAFHTIEKLLLPLADTMIFESGFAQESYCGLIGQPKCRQVVIHNGIAEDEFQPVVTDDTAADFVFVGELRRLKGYDLLLEALAPLTRPDGAPASLMLVGDGPDRAQVHEMVNSLGLSGRVELPGAQPARDMFAKGRCVVVPSRAESLPYIVMEAAAAGKPVIASRVGGIPEIFGPTEDRLVAPDDVGALRQAMQAFLSSPDEDREQTLLRRQYVSENFAAARMVSRIESVYYQCVNDR